MTANLKRVRLELARTAEYPEGNSGHGYEFIAPLNGDGHIDAEAWNKLKQRCWVRHFVGDESEQGMLRHVGRGWRFDYDSRSADDEPFFKLERHALTPGAYVSITEHDGTQRPFKVASVSPA